ncbi:hypothetical protein AB3331_11195 [Streptococcus sp. H49]|uniref:hypothetical protein n=1 Tax=Streptococcus huangxiaojuni TaxID=3237239 RepID=UPI0034A37AA4
MALTHQDIQAIQNVTKDLCSDETVLKGDKIPVETLNSNGKIVESNEYEVIDKINGTTQAIAVAPVVDGTTDYSQTAIVVAGT